MLPAGADPMDVRYNMINWVHRSTRGWSYGANVVDPRTGELIKGNVTLGSLRIRQNILIDSVLVGRDAAGDARGACEFGDMPDVAALLPPDPPTAERVAARLKLSNKAKKRLGSAANRDLGLNPKALAYRIGVEGAVDRLLLSNAPAEGKATAKWTPPRMPIGGNDVIARGVTEGPDVARTLRRIEDAWEAAGFPTGAPFERLVDEALV